MINLREASSKYYLAGRWEHDKRDLSYLETLRIKAILDLQFTPLDESRMLYELENRAKDFGIKYISLRMFDSEEYSTEEIEVLFDKGHTYLEEYEDSLVSKRDKILIKSGTGISRAPAMFLNHMCIQNRTDYEEEFIRLREVEVSNYGLNNFLKSSPNQAFSLYLLDKFPYNISP